MYCNFCGKNFEASEGFEEILRTGRHLTRCEECVGHQHEEEYDWRSEVGGRGAQNKRSPSIRNQKK